MGGLYAPFYAALVAPLTPQRGDYLLTIAAQGGNAIQARRHSP
jgi:hypothetical protein